MKSFKNKRKIKNDPTNWVVFENTNVAGKISDDRFERISTTYEIEQKDLQAQVAQLKIELTKEEESVAKSENFITVVKKYTEIKELTPTILNEFIEKIVIHAPVKIGGKRTQEVEIFYNSLGVLDLPDAEEMIIALAERKRKKQEQQQLTA